MPAFTTASVSMPAACMPAGVVEGEAAQALHHQHPLGDERRMRSRDHHLTLPGEREHPGDVEHVVGFESEVELLDDRLGEQLHQCRRIGERGDRDATDQMRSEPAHRLEVLRDQRRDRRTLHLHDHFFAGAEPGSVHLGDGCGGDRRAVEASEDRLQGRAEVGLDVLRTTSNGSAGTLSRSRRNSRTNSGGKMPSPDERIGPS